MIFILLVLLGVFSSQSAFQLQKAEGNSAGSVMRLEIPIVAKHSDIIGIKVTLPAGFEIAGSNALEPSTTQIHRLVNGAVRITIRDFLAKEESRTFFLSVKLPEEAGDYSVNVVWVYSDGRSDLLLDDARSPALSCLFCNTPCSWSDGMNITLKVVAVGGPLWQLIHSLIG